MDVTDELFCARLCSIMFILTRLCYFSRSFIDIIVHVLLICLLICLLVVDHISDYTPVR